MYIELIAEILVAGLAVFGFYTIIRLFVISHLMPPRAGVVIEIREGTAAQDIPQLLDSARDHLFFCGTRRMVALVDSSLGQDEALLDVLRDANVKFYVVSLR